MCMLQSLIRRQPVRFRVTSLLKACGNHILQAPLPPTGTSAQTFPSTGTAASLGEVGGSLRRYENPCLDLFFNLIPQKPATFVHLNRLLPPAWAHNPLTTLKIIRTYDEQDIAIGEDDTTQEEVFFKAVYWLHRNHPKTLASNLPYIMHHRTHYFTCIEILYRVLNLELVLPFGDQELENFSKAIEGDSDFRFLHDRISDLFAESLKFDIQNVNNHDHDDEEQEEILVVTDAIQHIKQAPLVLESVAKKVFPASSSVEDAVERLRKEVLDPLNKVFDGGYDTNQWGYKLVPISEESEEEKYLKDVKKSLDKMVPDALLPHEIVAFVQKEDLRQVVELQWKAMVEDLKKKYKERKQGILSNSLAVIHLGEYFSIIEVVEGLAMSLTILMSELSEEEAWKGKVIPLIPKPRLVLIQGDDLKSKCDFLREGVVKEEDHEADDYHGQTDFKRVFDLILQEAVDRSLKPEQMIKRLYVFTVYTDFEWTSGGGWQAQDCEAMQIKYNNHGYNMPHIVFWRLGDHLEPVQHSPDERGVATISGFRYACLRPVDAKFVKLFLENDGGMCPQHIMEANISPEDYDHGRLAVVD